MKKDVNNNKKGNQFGRFQNPPKKTSGYGPVPWNVWIGYVGFGTGTLGFGKVRTDVGLGCETVWILCINTRRDDGSARKGPSPSIFPSIHYSKD
jgi:hypothetical protein